MIIMYIKLEFESDIPIYEQLKNEIIIGIAKGELKAGERLPSVRALASDIGINLHTVNKAYQQLKQDGFLLIHRQRGVVINPDGIPQADALYKQSVRNIFRPIIAESIVKGMNSTEFQEITNAIFEELTIGKGEEK